MQQTRSLVPGSDGGDLAPMNQVPTLREAWIILSWKSSTRIFSLRSAVSSSVSAGGSARMPSFTLVAYSLKRRSRSPVCFVDCAASAGAVIAPSWPAQSASLSVAMLHATPSSHPTGQRALSAAGRPVSALLVVHASRHQPSLVSGGYTRVLGERTSESRTQQLLGQPGNALQDRALQRLQLAPLIAVRQAALHCEERPQLLLALQHCHEEGCKLGRPRLRDDLSCCCSMTCNPHSSGYPTYLALQLGEARRRVTSDWEMTG